MLRDEEKRFFLKKPRGKRKLRVGLLFGGRSGEHEVSLLSAASVMKAIDKSKYEVVPIGISKEGRWITSAQVAGMLISGPPVELAERAQPGNREAGENQKTKPLNSLRATGEQSDDGACSALAPFLSGPPDSAPNSKILDVDIVFPILHGTFGEDGTIQGLLEMADMPYVGAGVLGSAAGMDKDVMKRLFSSAGLPMVKHVTVLRREWEEQSSRVRRRVESSLKYPIFVKPANLGSSVGISKARNTLELGDAIALAASFDRKIVIEEGVGGRRYKAREIECSVLGNDEPRASIAGEVVPAAEFYDYAAKYLDQTSELLIPARLNRAELKQVQSLAIRAFQAVDCAGLARVDFLMHPRSRKIYVNEINTMPGFTAISMYPKLWAASGLQYPDLIDRLIQLALENYAEKKKNRYSM